MRVIKMICDKCNDKKIYKNLNDRNIKFQYEKQGGMIEKYITFCNRCKKKGNYNG